MFKVLLIDDNQLVGKMVRQYLERFDFTVDYTSSPFGVINKVKEFKPHVVLLDINLPGLSGDKIARLLRDNRERLCRFCLIAFSSEDEGLQRDLVDRNMVDGYILKTGKVEGLDLKIRSIAESVGAVIA